MALHVPARHDIFWFMYVHVSDGGTTFFSLSLYRSICHCMLRFMSLHALIYVTAYFSPWHCTFACRCIFLFKSMHFSVATVSFRLWHYMFQVVLQHVSIYVAACCSICHCMFQFMPLHVSFHAPSFHLISICTSESTSGSKWINLSPFFAATITCAFPGK
jgi:hypothetical protein